MQVPTEILETVRRMPRHTRSALQFAMEEADFVFTQLTVEMAVRQADATLYDLLDSLSSRPRDGEGPEASLTLPWRAIIDKCREHVIRRG